MVHPSNPGYTKTLWSAVPELTPEKKQKGDDRKDRRPFLLNEDLTTRQGYQLTPALLMHSFVVRSSLQLSG